MKFETERLILREYTPEDLPELYNMISDPITMKFYPATYTHEGSLRWLNWSLKNYEIYGFGWWAVILKENGQYIGDCGITYQNINGQVLPELGYHLHYPFHRKGYGKEAANRVLKWWFKEKGFDEIYSYMTKDNIASSSLAASVGMKRIDEFVDEDNTVCFVYKITKEEYIKG